MTRRFRLTNHGMVWRCLRAVAMFVGFFVSNVVPMPVLFGATLGTPLETASPEGDETSDSDADPIAPPGRNSLATADRQIAKLANAMFSPTHPACAGVRAAPLTVPVGRSARTSTLRC